MTRTTSLAAQGQRQLVDGQADESIIEQPKLSLASSLSRWPLSQSSANRGYGCFPVLLFDHPIDRCKKFHNQRRFEAVDALRRQVENLPEGFRSLLLEIQIHMPAMRFVEPDRIGGPGIAEPLVAVKIGPVKSIEHMAEAIREGAVLVGFELEIEGIVDPERMDRPL